MESNFFIHPIGKKEILLIASLEKICNPLPWKENDIERFAMDTSAYDPRQVGLCIDWVGPQPRACIGYICASQGWGESEILILGVDPHYRRRGLAKKLMLGLFEFMAQHHCQTFFLEVRKLNIPAIELYRSVGFKELGLRKAYYANDGDDALIFRRE